MEAVNKDNVQRIVGYLNNFTDWVNEWQNEFSDYGLSSPTFEALKKSVGATAELCNHILEAEDKDIEYLLLRLLQQDILE